MTKVLFTTSEKLGQIERIIQMLRRMAATENDEYQIDVIKSVAADLRGRLDSAPSIAVLELQRRIGAVYRRRAEDGDDYDAMKGVGEELIGRWPTVRQALEQFGESTIAPDAGEGEV